jgi:hypothetical protein
VPREPSRTIVTVTGNGTFLPPPVDPIDCDYIRTAPRLLDISLVVTHYLEDKKTELPTLNVDALAAACVEAVEKFGAANPGSLPRFAGRELFAVVLASYNPKTNTAHIRRFGVSITPAAEAQATPITVVDVPAENKVGFWAFGETDYLNRNVFGGVGLRFIPDSTRKFILGKKSAREVSSDEAAAVAQSIINAASLTTELVPPPSGIGGPVDIFSLGDHPQPQKISGK